MNLTSIRQNEPVVLYVGTGVTLVVAGLVAKGIVSNELGDWLLVGLTILLGGGGTAVARSKVTPQEKVIQAVNDKAGEVAVAVETAIKQANVPIPPQAQVVIDQVIDAAEYYGRHAKRP